MGNGMRAFRDVSFMDNASGSRSAQDAADKRPAPVPRCTLSSSRIRGQQDGARDRSPSWQEFANVTWLLPNDEALHSVLRPEALLGPKGFFRCCAGSRGSTPSPVPLGEAYAEDLWSYARFQACLLTQAWRKMVRPLQELLTSGSELRVLCACSLCLWPRLSSGLGSWWGSPTLPLIRTKSPATKDGGTTVELVCEHSWLEPSGSNRPNITGKIRGGEAVECWLALCRPAALWLGTVGKAGAGSIAPQICEALRVASAVRLSEKAVAEVWEALSELLASSPSFQRLPDGSWACVEGWSPLLR